MNDRATYRTACAVVSATLRPQRIGATLLGCLILLAPRSVSCADQPIDFDRQIRPLLSDNCFSCHGPDAAVRKADLRLDSREAAVDHGAINDAELTKSPILERILSDDPDKVMPPKDSAKQLNNAQKQLLKKWIEQGANYTKHWSFQAPRMPAIPAGASPIDYLVEQNLKKNGLAPAPPADPATLTRRLSLDLVGLPPVAADVNRLSAAPTRQNINQYIEQLLASPHYGERMAIGWLDVVRFADTIGYHSDTPRNVYPYRDYVIQSFNTNKPFDQFTIEQVAGDLLPDATQEQKVASCFNRLLLTTEEGGAQAKDYEARYLGDRVRAIGTVWLGLTIGCSQCHDHKFDPVTMQDFYAMGAFFADIDEAIIGKREEGMPVANANQSVQWQRLKVELATLQAEFDAPHPRLADAQATWENNLLAMSSASSSWKPLALAETKSREGQTLTATDDGSVLASGKRPNSDVVSVRSDAPESGLKISSLRLEALPHKSLPASGSGRANNGNFVLTEIVAHVVRADGKQEPIKFKQARASHEQTEKAEKNPYKRWSAESTIDNDAKGSEWGWAILPNVNKPQQLQLQLAEAIALSAGDQLHIEMQQNHSNGGHLVGHFRWSSSDNEQAFSAPLDEARLKELVAIIKTPAAERKPDQLARLRSAFHQEAPELASERQRIADAQKALTQFEAQLPKCLISKSMTKPRLVRILPRGNWQDESGPAVQPALPAFLVSNQPRTDRGLNRLDLANWLVSRDNPLTARVFVNRLWKHFFGIGLAKNLDDLGAQGESPAVPELLDYLALEFIQSGWDVKHMVRLIVQSRTYQQSSYTSRELLELDPENRLLARQSRFRLPAELVRDNALALAGLLSPDIGGPSIKPYQPDGYWENLNFPTRNYDADQAPKQHRRGLYVWWQRSFVHPSMLAFDAPTREECAADRSQSNIPQQALVLLNDPTYVEAAHGLAIRMLEQSLTQTTQTTQTTLSVPASGSTTAEQGSAASAPTNANSEKPTLDLQQVSASIAWAFKEATARSPSDSELSQLVKLYQHANQSFESDEAAAAALAGSARSQSSHLDRLTCSKPQYAALVQVARAILNLHEVITRN